MIALARNRAISDAVLLSGDEDLRVGVQQAQEFGVRVHLVGVKPSRGSQSLFLLQEADMTYEWSNDEVSEFLARKPKVVTPSVAPPVPGNAVLGLEVDTAAVDRLGLLASKVADVLEKNELLALVEAFEETSQLPRDIDRRLLADGRSAIRRDLSPSEKKHVRSRFIGACRRRLAD